MPGYREMRDESTPLGSVVESFLISRDDLSDRTAGNYGRALGAFSEWVKANKGREAVVGDVNPDLVNLYKRDREKTSPDSARSAVVALKSLAKFLLERRIWHDDGYSVLRLVKTPQSDRTRRAMTDEEVRKVISSARDGRMGARDHCIVLLALGTGLRLKELAHLRLEDLDLVEGLLAVRAHNTKGRKGYRKERSVTLWPEVVRELDRYIKDERRGKDFAEESLFTDSRGVPLTHSGLGQVFKRVKQRSKVAVFCAHVCRHTWATRYRRVGSGDLFDLQEEGGWSDLRMVRRYSKGRPMEERKKSPSPLSGLFGTVAERRSNQQRVAVAA